MNRKFLIYLALLLTVAMTSSTVNTRTAKAQETSLRIVPTVTELGPENAEGTIFTISCFIENVEDLYGLDIQIGWSREIIQYIDHIKTIPVETYPHGTLHADTFAVKDEVNETGGLEAEGAEPGTMYWLSEASLAPAEPFTGTGIAFNMTFQIKRHPVLVDTYIYINITSSTLADSLANPIPHNQISAQILLHGRDQPAGPTISISSVQYKGVTPYTFEVDVALSNLDWYWDLGGYDLQLTYDPQIIKATNITIDPEGWFEAAWPGGILTVINEIDNNQGVVWIVILGIPGDSGEHTELEGGGTLFKVTFETLASGPIEVNLTPPRYLAGLPHPERSESPYEGSISSVPIPYTAYDGFAHVIAVLQHDITVDSNVYTVTTESNSSVTDVQFQQEFSTLMFKVTGAEGYQGFCNITIPKSFMWSSDDSWMLLLDGQPWPYTVTSDGTNTYIYFTYPQSTHNVTLISQNVIPEFSPAIMIVAILLAAAAIALTKKKLQ